jgi:hypothetical protein
MNDRDRQLEQHLRRQAISNSRNASARGHALVLADFYEQQGQLSRASLWRYWATLRRRRAVADDLLGPDPKQKRRVMMWLLRHVVSRGDVARLFKSSPSWARHTIATVEKAVCEAANRERHQPTLAATQRLQAAGALPKPYEQGTFRLGEEPPDYWPARSGTAAR